MIVKVEFENAKKCLGICVSVFARLYVQGETSWGAEII